MATAAVIGLTALGVVAITLVVSVVAKLALHLVKRPLETRIAAHYGPDEILRRLLNLLWSPLYRTQMAAWIAKVDCIVAEPPGSDVGFSVDDIIRNGETDFSKLTTWEIVCEEVLDTSYPCIYFERARDELRRRGISDEEYDQMRRFAWLTAGWLNFAMNLWEWRLLTDSDIHRAIDCQFRDGWISQSDRKRLTAFANRYATKFGRTSD